jgi:hypothetical protein
MKTGDWVVVYRSKLDRSSGRYVETVSATVRIARRTPTQIWVDYSSGSFRLKDGVWEQKRYLYEDAMCLRAATAEEIQQGEEAERKRTEAERKYKEACDEKRVELAGIDWATIDDLTVDNVHKMATDQRNLIPQPKKKGK